MIKIKRLSDRAVMPERKTSGAACVDLHACFPDDDDKIWIDKGTVARIPLGFAMEIPEGYCAKIWPRSGHTKRGIIAQIGTIDSDYRGEVCALIHSASKLVSISHGERVAQMSIEKVEDARFFEVDELSETERGAGGFGSTGLK